MRQEGDYIYLNIAEVAEIHYLLISHLNSLEIALLSWRDGIADKEIIEEQLSYVVKNDNEDVEGEFFLVHFRNVIGEKAYPAIHAFIEHLKKNKSQYYQ